MTQNYRDYVEQVTDDIKTCLENMECQPILFIGSGLSKRYFNGPNWEELLRILADQCPLINKEYAYYKQTCAGSPIRIGDEFSVLFDSITPSTEDSIHEDFKEEIKLLQAIRPHTIITTNYDRLLELLFPNYEPIIGQKILRGNATSVGEIFKIHGCTTEPESLVLLTKDYDDFSSKQKYLSAKLLTYFAEHPLVFIGYSAKDPNIQAILSNIDEILSSENELIPNIYILNWQQEILGTMFPPREELISTGPHRSVRINSITASSFNWVFDAFGATSGIEKVNPKMLRALLARTYDLVRCDIPKKVIEVDYQALERAVCSDGVLAKLYGLTVISGPTGVNIAYPYTLTGVGKKLGYNGWHNANILLNLIKQEKGINIKTSDNRYHIAIMSGETTKTHKYSEELIDILLKVKASDMSFELIL